MKNKTPTLTPAQQRAISALLSARNVADAAKASGVALRTLGRWLTDDMFKAALQAAQSAVLATSVMRMTNATGQAMDVLCDVMADGDSDSIKLRGALGMLALLPAMKQLSDFEARLQALEVTAQGLEHAGH